MTECRAETPSFLSFHFVIIKCRSKCLKCLSADGEHFSQGEKYLSGPGSEKQEILELVIIISLLLKYQI